MVFQFISYVVLYKVMSMVFQFIKFKSMSLCFYGVSIHNMLVFTSLGI